jgi:hypothetical protein
MTGTEATLIAAICGLVGVIAGGAAIFFWMDKKYVSKATCTARNTDICKDLGEIKTELKRGNRIFLAIIAKMAEDHPEHLGDLLGELGVLNGNGSKK